MASAPQSLFDGSIPEKIGLFGLSQVLPLLESTFGKLPYHFEAYSELDGFCRWVDSDRPRVILLEGPLFQEVQSHPVCEKLKQVLIKSGIPSVIFVRSREEIKKWSEGWPMAHFFLGPVSGDAVRKKIAGVMAEGLFPEMPLAVIMSDKPFLKSHLEMLLKNVGLRVMTLAHMEKNRDRVTGQLAARPDFYIWDVTSKSWTEEEIKKVLALVSPGKNIPGFLVSESGHPEKSFTDREVYRLDDTSKLMEAIHMQLKKDKNIQLKTCRNIQTGLYLPEIFMELTEREMALAVRSGDKFSILRVSLGNLEGMEQNYGPIFVKELKLHLGLFIQNRVRSTDLVAQSGNGEILLLLTRVSRDLASLIGERLHHSFVKEASFPDGKETHFTPKFDYEILTFPDDVSSLQEIHAALTAPKAMVQALQSDG